MSKSKDPTVEKLRRSTAALTEKTALNDDVGAWSRTVRETVESVVIAFVLAFLFRTFEAEAFVIPTGSMAPTLMGRHMDLKCPKCGFVYQVGAPDDDKSPLDHKQSCLCPNCRYEIAADERSQYYNGDRILVNKFSFDFTEPKRWDVIVFKYPEDAKTNYIKRLIGLPGEVIRIRDGDIGVSHDGGKTFELARKEPAKLRAMLQTVYDNDYVYEPFLAKGWPARWQGDPSWANAKREGAAADPKVFVSDGKQNGGNAPAIAWLRYSNYVPSNLDWEAFDADRPLNSSPPVEPIVDFIAYDEPSRRGNREPYEIVSDLAIECEVNVEHAAGKVVLELSKAGRRFECQLDLTTGKVELTIPERHPGEQPRSTGGISRSGNYRLLFANVDHQLTLLIDNKPVQFDKPTTYGEFDGEKEADLQAARRAESPAQIGSLGAALSVSHLRVLRDIYYTWGHQQRAGSDAVCFPVSARAKLQAVGTEMRPYDQYYFVGQDGDGLAWEDQFFPLGDNSPSSQDGRFWQTQHFVDRRLLVGKALFIYWPHSFDKIGSIPFPFFPNFGRMGYVR